MTNEKNIAGLYVRLSDEDRNKVGDEDSESIQNQKNMLVEYAIKNNWKIYDIYSDDDYSGADEAISRPEFQRLMKDAQAGKIDIVLAKSQSRFTRDMEYVERILHKEFIRWHIRFVSITDNADTAVKGNKKSRQINGLVNEWYVEDLSENIKAAFAIKRKMGQFIGAFVAYGYLRDPQNKNHLIIDPVAAAVVQEIFKLYLEGYGLTRIAQKLNSRGLPCPAEYKRLQGLNYVPRQRGERGRIWRSSSINVILKNQIYTGDMVQGKTGTISYKNSKKVKKDRNEWFIVPNTHEPIISREQFEMVSQIGRQRTRPEQNGKKHIFSGKIFCGECGAVLIKHHGTAENRYFICPMKKYGICEKGVSVSYKLVYQAVFDGIKRIIGEYSDEAMLDGMIHCEDSVENKLEQIIQLKKSLLQQKSDTASALENLYIDKVKGIITEDQFIVLSRRMSEKNLALEKQMNRLDKETDQYQEQIDIVEEKRKVIHKYIEIEDLTREMIDEFVEGIYVKNSIIQREKEITVKWKI